MISAKTPAADLRAAVAAVVPFVERRNTIPILGAIRLSFDGSPSVEHRDLDHSVRYEFHGTGQGTACIPAHTLAAFLAATTADVVEILTDDKTGRILLTCGALSASIAPLGKAIDMPDTLAMPGCATDAIDLAEGVFAHLLAKTLPFVSTEETRYYLNGVAFEIIDGAELGATSTDGHRLSRCVADLPAPRPDMANFIIPRGLLARLHPMAAGAEVALQFAPSANRVRISIGRLSVIAKGIDGTYPDWRRLIPKTHAARATMPAADVIRFSGLVHKMIGGRGRPAAITPCSSGLRVTCKNPEGGDVQAEIGGSSEGWTVGRIGFNVRYLSDIAKALGTREIDLELDANSSGSPTILRGRGAPTRDFAVLMPTRI